MNAAFVFSGQGAQSTGMGRDLCESSPAAAAIFKTADETLGWSVSEICFNGPEERLTESRYCQPAIYTVSAACLAAFREKYPEVKASGCGGLSLGEFAALYASGVFDFADGLKLVARRGEFMDEACKESKGGMASVLGGDPEIIREVCNDCDIDVANYNCPGQVVISGEAEKVEKAVASLKEKGLRKVIPLKVAGAYHSRLMKSAGDNLRGLLEEMKFNAPQLPLVQNYTGGAVCEPGEIKRNLVNQVAGSVRWEECLRVLIEQGADTVIEFGPGNVLTGLAKRTDRNLKLYNINSTETLSAFEAD